MEEMLERLERLEAERLVLIEFFRDLSTEPALDRRLRDKFGELAKVMTDAKG